jgi:hypothetical protein
LIKEGIVTEEEVNALIAERVRRRGARERETKGR